MKKMILFLILCIVLALSGCEPIGEESEYEVEENEHQEVTKEEYEEPIEESEFEVLSYDSYHAYATAVLVDTKENILYGMVKVYLNNAGSHPGEFFMLVDKDGNPLEYNYNSQNIPKLICRSASVDERDNIYTCVFTDSVHKVRYALIFTMNNHMGAYTANVITLQDVEGKPSTYNK